LYSAADTVSRALLKQVDMLLESSVQFLEVRVRHTGGRSTAEAKIAPRPGTNWT